MGQYNAPDAASGSGIKVLDRAVLILTTIADQPRSLAELCQATKLPARPHTDWPQPWKRTAC